MQPPARKTQPLINALAIFLSLMDACWIYIVAWLFSGLVLSPISVFSVPQPVMLALLEVGGLGVAAYLIRRRGAGDIALRVALGLAGMVAALLTTLSHIPLDVDNFNVVYFVPFFFIFLLALGVWVLGGYRATDPDSFDRAYFHFRLGLSAIAVATLFVTLITGGKANSLWSELWGAALLFFGAGLAALALGNRETVRRETADAGLHSWGRLLAVSIGLILMLGVFAQALGAGDIVSALQSGVVGVLAVVGGLLYLLAVVLLWPLSLCGIRFERAPNTSATPTPTPGPNPLERLQGFQQQDRGYNPLNIPAGLLIVAVALFFMLRWLRTHRADHVEPLEEEHERFGSWALLWSQVRAWLDRLLGRFRKPTVAPTPAAEDDLASLAGRPDMAGTLTIRQIYARLLGYARNAGYPRAPQQTPNEYLRVLSNSLPDLRPDLEAITSAYVEARYSPYPASSMAVNSANEAWRRMEIALAMPVGERHS
jgi:Domain of unknown function (DUF4129)